MKCYTSIDSLFAINYKCSNNFQAFKLKIIIVYCLVLYIPYYVCYHFVNSNILSEQKQFLFYLFYSVKISCLWFIFLLVIFVYQTFASIFFGNVSKFLFVLCFHLQCLLHIYCQCKIEFASLVFLSVCIVEIMLKSTVSMTILNNNS